MHVRRIAPSVLLCAVVTIALPLTVRAYAQESAAIAPSGSDAGPFKVGGNVLPPKLISSVEPKYPRPLFRKPKPSMVLVGLVVATDGTPKEVHVLKSGGSMFDKSALEAVNQYRFEPGTRDGKPVQVQINVQVQFGIF